jgi:hypothetical protein
MLVLIIVKRQAAQRQSANTKRSNADSNISHIAFVSLAGATAFDLPQILSATIT